MPRLALLLATLALLALLAATGQAQETSEQGQGTRTLGPGQQEHPLPTSLAAGDAIVFDWEVTDPPGGVLYFSTHIHIGAQLVNLTEETVSGKQGSLVADRPGLYSLLWQNDGNESVTYRYSYHAERQPAPAKTPFPAPWAALAVLAGGALLRRCR